MSSFYLILALIFSLLIAIVALANNDTVTVSYLFGRREVSLILLILGSAFAGALVMGLFSLFRTIRTALTFREMRHQHDDLRKKLKSVEEEKLFLEAELNKCSSVPEDLESDEKESVFNHTDQQVTEPEPDNTADQVDRIKEEVEDNNS